MDDDLEREFREVCVIRLQAGGRRYLARCLAIRLVNQRYEKILDM